MKRQFKVGMLLLGALLFAAPAFAHGGGYGRYGMGPGMPGGAFCSGSGMGPGMMGGGYGMGPGMMGGGYGRYGMGSGMMGGGFGMGLGPLAMHPELAQLPADKQEQLQKLALSTMQAMITKRAELQVKRLALAETMQTYPLDQKAASEQWAAVDQARKDLFNLMTGSMAQAHQIIGKELWEQMHSGRAYGGYRFGHGPGAGPVPGMPGPGMMGPPQAQ